MKKTDIINNVWVTEEQKTQAEIETDIITAEKARLSEVVKDKITKETILSKAEVSIK